MNYNNHWYYTHNLTTWRQPREAHIGLGLDSQKTICRPINIARPTEPVKLIELFYI